MAASRQSWAFCRDGALPFSGFFRVISIKFGYPLPFRAIWGCVGLAIVLGLLCLIATAAANALFSLLIIGNNVAYIVPIFCRAVWGNDVFVPGPFYTGRASKPIAYFSVVFLIFGVVCTADFQEHYSGLTRLARSSPCSQMVVRLQMVRLSLLPTNRQC